MLNLYPIPAYVDNYIWCLHDNHCAYLIDPGDASKAQGYLEDRELTLLGILVTHHHWDHVNGIQALTELYPDCHVWGPKNETIPCCNYPLAEGDIVKTKLDIDFSVLEFPGHTLGHIGFYAEQSAWGPLLFCGDTLFSAGCGRLFEGTAAQMHNSLSKIGLLPTDLVICCTHEYTEANLKFAIAVDPGNEAIEQYMNLVKILRSENRPSLPTTLNQERLINPFLRIADPSIQSQLVKKYGHKPESDAESFAMLRTWKDNF